MPSDAELRDAAVAELRLTSVGFVNKKWTTPPAGSHWANALGLLSQVGAAPSPPPPPSGLVVAAPVGPLADIPGPGQSGIFLRDAGSPVTAKKHVHGFTDYGIGNMVWPAQPSTGTWALTDCAVEDITRNPPRSSNGTAEAGYWIGQRTTAARLTAARCAWMGMWTGAKCDGSLIEDFELLEMPLVGLYCEHVTSNSRFRRFRINSASNCVNVEWWYGGAGSHDLIFEDFDIHTDNGWGFFLDAGTYGCTIRNGKISGKNGIAHPLNLVDPSRPNLIDWASIDMSGVTGTKQWQHGNAIG